MDPNRRMVLIAGLATTAAGVAAASAAGKGLSAMETASGSPPPLGGEIKFDKQSRAAAADDFGHIVHRTPRAVVLPASDDDVATAIHWAARQHRKVAPQGQSHPVFGCAPASDRSGSSRGQL
jgi:cytokinin dehydrogenase